MAASSLKGVALEDYVADNLSRFSLDLSLVGRQGQVADRGFDIHARDSKGVDYYIEVKASECNRLSIGQIVEYKANLAKVAPKAKVILVCRDVDAEIKDVLKKIGVDVWTFSDFRVPESIFGNVAEKAGQLELSPVENILSKLARHGAVQRVGRGKYVVIPADVMYGRKSYVADPLVLASELMKGNEYCVAYCSAAHVHGLTEQMPFRTTVAVLKQMRPIEVGNVSVSFVTLKKPKFFGCEDVKYLDVTLKVSDLEKTVVDCVDRPELCGGLSEVVRILLNAFEDKRMNYQKLVSYVKRFGSHAVAQRLGFILQYLKERKRIRVDSEVFDGLLQLVGSKVYPLDVKASRVGGVSRKWKILNNAGYLEV